MSYSVLCVWYITNGTSTYPSNNFRPVLKRTRQKDSESAIVVKRGQVHHVLFFLQKTSFCLIFVCEWHTSVVRQNHRNKLSSEHCMCIIYVFGKYNNHKNHMLYQKNKKLQAVQRGTKNKIKTCSNKNKYTFEIALLGVDSGFESRYSRALQNRS